MDCLKIIDTFHLTSYQKLWFLQDLLIPYIQWPILVYKVPISLVLKLEEKKASVYIRKWVKLHKFITSLLFYSCPCPLPVRNLTSLLKSSKISRDIVIKNSQDLSVSSCVPKLQAVNWQVEKAVQACETDLRHKSIVEHHKHICHGLEYIKSSKFPFEKSSIEYRAFYFHPSQRNC